MYAAMRREGKFLDVACRLTVPPTIIHGQDDPHPVEGVTAPLLANGIPCHLHLLPRCSHFPFNEIHARDTFLQILLRIINGEK